MRKQTLPRQSLITRTTTPKKRTLRNTRTAKRAIRMIPSSPHTIRTPGEGGGDSCCSTLMATAQIAKPFSAAQPLLESFKFPCTVLQARDPMLAAPEAKPLSQAKDHDLVLTPVVCLGPAHRSLAPPSFA